MRRSLALLLAGGLMLAVAVAPASAQINQVTPAAPQVIDGPSASIIGLDGLSIAHDGTGGLVYLKDVAGVAHVFVSSLASTFQAPQEVDSSLTGASSQPLIAAANGGMLLVAFISGGNLYVSSRSTAPASFSRPQELAQDASNPALALSNTGEAYLAFTAPDPSGGDDVRCAYYFQGSWQLIPAPLNATAGDDAGTGSGRPAVAVAGDGVGIVVWGEAGHVYSRRVSGTSPSVDYQRADVPAAGGWSEVSSGEPAVAAGGDSSYVAVAFDEQLTDGHTDQSRVLLRVLVAGAYQPAYPADGLTTPGTVGAQDPQVALTDYSRGFVTSSLDPSNDVIATVLNQNVVPAGAERVDSLANSSAPLAVPATAGLFSTLIAWQHDPGSGGSPEIRVRYAPDGSDLGSEVVLSQPALGPTDASDGLFAGGDYDGNAVVAWVQGNAGDLQIVADQLYKPPGGFGNGARLTYVNSAQPQLSWSASHDVWGPVRYTVTIGGAYAGETTATTLTVPAALSNGPHTWQVTATNAAGLQASTGVATVFVDTVPPTVAFSVGGVREAGRLLHLAVSDADPPPPGLPASDASGIATVTINWGDGSGASGTYHAYERAGDYTVTVTVTDRAGNSSTVSTKLKIKRKPVKKKKKKKKPKPGTLSDRGRRRDIRAT